MSKSSRTPHLKTRKSRKRAAAPAGAPTPRRPPAHRWRGGRIDYGPAIRAARSLAVWAFGLAAREVAGRPEEQRRVRAARQFVLASLRGDHPAVAPNEELMFTMLLLARLFEVGRRVPEADAAAFCGQLRLAAEVLPFMLRAQSATCPPPGPQHAPTQPYAPPAPPISPVSPLRPRPGASAARPAPTSGCAECGPFGLPFRFAA